MGGRGMVKSTRTANRGFVGVGRRRYKAPSGGEAVRAAPIQQEPCQMQLSAALLNNHYISGVCAADDRGVKNGRGFSCRDFVQDVVDCVQCMVWFVVPPLGGFGRFVVPPLGGFGRFVVPPLGGLGLKLAALSRSWASNRLKAELRTGRESLFAMTLFIISRNDKSRADCG
jgi:hypothetical protein